MADAKSSPLDSPLMFPAFMYGDKTTCRRKMRAEAKKWAKCYAEGRPFPEPKLIPIAPGSLVFTSESTSNWVGSGYSLVAPNVAIVNANAKEEGLHIQWRAYMLDMLRLEASTGGGLPHEERFAFRRAFLKSVCQSPWGAISAAAIPNVLNSIEFTVPRIEAVLRYWEVLDTLKYIDADERPITLTQFMTARFHGNVAMWVDHPIGDIRIDLGTAIAEMRKATDEEVYARLLKRLRAFVDIDKDLKHREWLKSPGVIEAELERYRSTNYEWYDWLTSGKYYEHGAFFGGLDRDYVPPTPQTDPVTPEKP